MWCHELENIQRRTSSQMELAIWGKSWNIAQLFDNIAGLKYIKSSQKSSLGWNKGNCNSYLHVDKEDF